MNRMNPGVPATPSEPTATVVEEDARKVIGAFFLAIALYLAVGFGTIAQEKLAANDNVTEMLAADATTSIEVASLD